MMCSKFQNIARAPQWLWDRLTSSKANCIVSNHSLKLYSIILQICTWYQCYNIYSHNFCKRILLNYLRLLTILSVISRVFIYYIVYRYRWTHPSKFGFGARIAIIFWHWWEIELQATVSWSAMEQPSQNVADAQGVLTMTPTMNSAKDALSCDTKSSLLLDVSSFRLLSSQTTVMKASKGWANVVKDHVIWWVSGNRGFCVATSTFISYLDNSSWPINISVLWSQKACIVFFLNAEAFTIVSKEVMEGANTGSWKESVEFKKCNNFDEILVTVPLSGCSK